MTTLLCAARVSTADFVLGLIVTTGVLALLELPELLDSLVLLALSAFSALLVLLDSLEPLELLELPELPELFGRSGPAIFRTRLLSFFSTVPVIVAVTNVAVGSGTMTPATASVLVTAGAITVLLIPVVTSFVRVTAEVHPLEAARELTSGQAPLREVVERHRRGFRAEEARFQRHRHKHGAEPEYSSADYLAAEGVRQGDGSPVSSQVRQGDAPSVSSQSQEQPRPQEQQPQQQPHEPKDSAGEGPAKEEIENDRR